MSFDRVGRVAVVVMVKVPSAEQGKTRLCLEPSRRIELSRAMIEDKLDQLRSLDADVYVAYAPPADETTVRAWLGDVRTLEQQGGDLGERLRCVVKELLARGHGGVVVVDGDTPNLPPSSLAEAVNAISDPSIDLVLGPAWDGGYYAIGLRADAPVFEGIPWSTRMVLTATIAAARGMSVHLLPAWYDVDTPDDLARLRRDLADTPRFSPGYPRRTAAVLGVVATPAVEHRGPFRTLSRRPAYQNRWIHVTESVVDVGPSLTLYGVVRAEPCVGVLPRDLDGEVILVQQYRYVGDQVTWEIPTGGVHDGESLEDAAHRELREEAGFDATTLRSLGSFRTSKSVLDEVATLFLGEQLIPSRARGDDSEQIVTRRVPFAEALSMVERGEIVDSMSIIAILRAAALR